MKSKMLWRPGCVPVLNDDQATGDTDGNVVCSRRYAPVSLSALKLGRCPSAMNRSVSAGILAVEPDDHEPSDAGTRRSASAQPPPQHPERPEEQ
jgi:hypothetical protein